MVEHLPAPQDQTQRIALRRVALARPERFLDLPGSADGRVSGRLVKLRVTGRAYFDLISADLRRRLDLLDVGIDEEADEDAGVIQFLDALADRFLVRRDVEPAFGRPLDYYTGLVFEVNMREDHRVLAGGRYLFSVWDSHRHNPFGRIAHETAASFFPADPPQFYMVPFSYYQIDPIKESLIDAGFTDISVAVIRLEKEIPDAARFARGLVHGNPLIDQIKARGGVDPDRIVDALAQALRQEFGADPGRMPLQAIVFSASRR